MSYCRFSSDNFKCDIYAYESVHNCYTIHVASNRIIGEAPRSDYNLLNNGEPTEENKAKFIEQEKIRNKFFVECKRKQIGLPYDGESFDEPDLESFYNRLIELRNIGYMFPDYVLEEIKEEMAL